MKAPQCGKTRGEKGVKGPPQTYPINVLINYVLQQSAQDLRGHHLEAINQIFT